uniref:Intraflagellar transport protein 43 n=1 Tax=Lygus hesperus TaxID=30085 RepID=A0A146KT41_LYGHE
MMDRSDLSLSPIRGSDGTPRRTQNAFWTDSSYRAKNSPQELSPKHREREDSEDDIPLIPDIDELQEDEFYNDIAAAPDLPSTNLSFIQLNSDLKKYAAFSVVDNVNLGLLSKHLFKESDLKENDNKWSWDLLFTEVSSDLRSEWEASKEPNLGQ